MSRNKKIFASFLGVLAVFSICTLIWVAKSASGTTNSAEYKQDMQDALAEAGMATNNNLASITAAPNNLANFIYNRSGVQISQANKNSLAQLEEKSWAQSKRIPQDDLTDILTDVALKRLGNLSDTDIDNMADTLMGFKAPNMPSNYLREDVMLRFSGEGKMTPAYFKDQVKSARSSVRACNPLCSGQANFNARMTRTALRNRVSSEILGLMTRLGEADPTFSEGNTDSMTPTEALFITYAVVSNDTIAGNINKLQETMTALQYTMSQPSEQFPSPQGYRPFGTNGYLFSSPTTLLLDDASVAEVLTRIQEVSNIQ